MPELDDVRRRMREDWNQRAVEDAHYYVAFGRRQQTDEEFFDTAREQVLGLERELARLGAAGNRRARRALEIGCGPGRLMKPMSAHFGEIHGVDVSEEMVARAARNLAAIPHAHVRPTPNSDLAAFADASFDFIYSYAVFQHIPSREVVLGYLAEAARVLKPGGLIRCQLNGLPASAKTYDTWAGVRIAPEEVRAVAREHGLQLLALEGTGTQYMWTTLRRAATAAGEAEVAVGLAAIHRVTNANSSEPVAPVRGRFAALSLWVAGLGGADDLLRLGVLVDGRPAFLTYLGARERDGLQQLNLHLPEGLASGVKTVTLTSGGEPVAESIVRLMRPGPLGPRVLALSDGIDLLSGRRIVTGSVKATLEEVADPELLTAEVRWPGGAGAGRDLEHFCINPHIPSHELNFRLPEAAPAGPAEVTVAMGRRMLGRTAIQIGAAGAAD
ncbi:MAG: class I SAM-dependent methyltransferase [Bryobacterales bacterium]|nr:class I SAM-dependent methyltransferase [Bryobacterales bacterium]